MKPAIEGRKLLVKKGHQVILDELVFRVQPGTLTGLIGPSGSGKTTLMRTIIGAQKMAGGELDVLGVPAGSAALRSQIGYVTQSPAVYGDLTVEQNLKYFATLMRANPSDIQDAITIVDLHPQRHQLVASLSGGQTARVNLAVALLGSPNLLVLDEPTIGLDPILRNDLWDLFSRLASSGKTLLVSSHVMDEAERCDEIILLRNGRVLWNDGKEALLTYTGKPDVSSAFVAMIEKESE